MTCRLSRAGPTERRRYLVRIACPLALAPSTSTTVMLALGDALAFTLLEQRQFTAEEFAKFHPAGSLGRKLAVVADWMRKGDDLRVAPETDTVREVFARKPYDPAVLRPGEREPLTA